jgi:amidohydrolase
MTTDRDRRLHSQDAESVRQLEPAIDAFADEHQAAWIAYRRERHCAPEASGEETETSHSVCERLKSLGISAVIPDRGVGVVGDLLFGDATPETPAIAIRADIDALRMSDRKDAGYASIKDGMAHACGHDVHTTIVLGVAEVLTHLGHSALIEVPSGRIRFLFQAAEETCDGATWMVEDGMLAGVRSILGVHVEPNLLAGQIGVRYGVFTACVDEVFITVSGRGGHAARPHNTTDPIHAAAMLTSDLYQMLPRNTDVRDASVFTVCQINGGHTSNVIPDEVRLAGTLRTTDAAGREKLMQRINDISQSIATVTGNTIDVDFRHPLGSVINSSRETSAIEIAALQVFREQDIVLLDRPSMGGEDFAMYLDHCTGSQMRLGCAASQPWPHLHSPVFDIDESAIAYGVRILARAVLLLMTK